MMEMRYIFFLSIMQSDIDDDSPFPSGGGGIGGIKLPDASKFV